MGLRPEVGHSVPYWRTRRLIRNVVWLVGGLLVAYLLLLNLQKSRDLEKTVKEKAAAQAEQVNNLSQLLQLVEQGQAAAVAAGRPPSVTMDQAVAALKKTFPIDVVNQAVAQAARHEPPLTTTTTRAASTTTQATTTTTAAAASTSSSSTTTSTATTTTTSCLLNLLLLHLGCR